MSDAFQLMAERILKNKEEAFGGAVVIVPPEGGGETIELLQLGTADVMQFWGALSAKIAMTVKDLQDRQRQGFR